MCGSQGGGKLSNSVTVVVGMFLEGEMEIGVRPNAELLIKGKSP